MTIVPRCFTLALAALALSACMGTSESTGDGSSAIDGLDSGFRTPPATGFYSSPVTGTPFAITQADSTGTGYSITAGPEPAFGIATEAGLLRGSEVSFRPGTLTGSYTGRYDIVMFEDVQRSGNRISSRPVRAIGTLTMEADYGGDTITVRAGDLRMDGQLVNRDLAGTVSFRGVRGQLQGLVGGNKTVGVFHGHNRDLAYAGGFLAERTR